MVLASTRARAAACLLAASALSTACGLQDGGRSVAAAGPSPVSAAVSATTPEPVQTSTPDVVAAATAAAPPAAAASTGPAAPPARVASTTAGRAPRPSPRSTPSRRSGTTTGIDLAANTITVALHTSGGGAAGARKYWEQSGPGGGPRLVRGFRVRVEVLDDDANSRSALRACSAAAKRAFLIVSQADIDQLHACAQGQVLRSQRVPYLSWGRTETGLDDLPHYFATSLTLRQQSSAGVLMARENRFLDGRWAVLIADRPDLEPVRASVVAQLQQAKVQGRAGAFDPEQDVFVTERAANNCEAVAEQLRTGRYGAVYVLGLPPLLLAQCVRGHPTAVYTGPGPSYATQPVAALLCQATLGRFSGYFLHPVPDLRTAQRMATGAPQLEDDAEVTAWASMQLLEQALLLPRQSLTRETFLDALARGGTSGGLLPPTSYDGRTRFGGTAAYGNRISCAGGQASISTVGRYASTTR